MPSAPALPHPCARSAAAAALLVALALAWAPLSAHAHPLDTKDVPEPLQPWIGWALDGVHDQACSWYFEKQHCIWPGHLSVSLEQTGGRFDLSVLTEGRHWVDLPGERGNFPLDVRVDGKLVPVAERSDTHTPIVLVEPGRYRITGRFAFDSMPELLRVPRQVAMIDLEVNGARIETPRRNDEGKLWVGKRPAVDSEGTLELEVFRKITDGLPLSITTRIRGRVSGETRDLKLNRVTLEGMVPTEFESTVPARLDPDGVLSAQIQAGSFQFTVVSRRADPAAEFTLQAREAPWPGSETWIWVADETLRQVELSGALAIDPARTNLPRDWRGHPTYMMTAGTTLSFATTRRGEPEPPPNALILSRDIWLDLDGAHYTVRDELTGQMNRDWRLELREGTLGRVALGNFDQLVTRLDEGQSAGVEVRMGALRMLADWRLARTAGDLPAVGWSENAQRLQASLRLPPGWSLLGASGVDHVGNAWLDAWDLWDLFLVLLVSLAVGRLVGVGPAVLALLCLTLGTHQPNAPLLLWLPLLFLLALLKNLPTGTPRRICGVLFWGSALVLVLGAIPYATQELRAGLFPFTRMQAGPGGWSQVEGFQESLEKAEVDQAGVKKESKKTKNRYGIEGPADNEDPYMAREKAKAEAVTAGILGVLGARTGALTASTGQQWIDPNAVVQTGPGIPAGAFSRHPLGWDGPVDAAQRFELWLLPPWLNRLIAFARVLLLGMLFLVLLRARPRGPTDAGGDTTQRRAGARAAGGGTASLALLLGLGSAWSPASGSAQDVPADVSILELRERLLRPPECHPDCTLASSLQVRTEGQRLILDAVVHTGARAAYRIPGPANLWLPDRVEVDGKPSEDLAQLEDQYLFLRLPEGRHRVHMEGPIRGGNRLTLSFEEPPHHLEVQAPGWKVEGLRKDGQVSPSIQLRRQDLQGSPEIEQELPHWLQIRRQLEVGVRRTLTSTARRVTPLGTPVVLRVPLLQGESVTSTDVVVEDGEAVISLGRDDAQVRWESVLEERPRLTLSAAAGRRYNESWTLDCSPIWHCSHEGLAPVQHQSRRNWQPHFKPWPGDQLTLHFTRPRATPGQSITIDRAALALSPGARMLEAELRLTVRASQGGSQELRLPPEARLRSLEIDGKDRPAQLHNGQLAITITPGRQEIALTWQQPREDDLLFTAPAVELAASAVNASVRVTMPASRWVLWTQGPAWGNAVMFWPYLLLVVLIGVALGWTRAAHLSAGAWILLGLGLTQIPALAALTLVGWFALLAHRESVTDLPPLAFNLRQALIPVYTLVAVAILLRGVHSGLLGTPDMQFINYTGSSDAPIWYVDRFGPSMPQPWVLSLPLWVWRVLMLLWALWLASRVVQWARWSWAAFCLDGLWLDESDDDKGDGDKGDGDKGDDDKGDDDKGDGDKGDGDKGDGDKGDKGDGDKDDGDKGDDDKGDDDKGTA